MNLNDIESLLESKFENFYKVVLGKSSELNQKERDALIHVLIDEFIEKAFENFKRSEKKLTKKEEKSLKIELMNLATKFKGNFEEKLREQKKNVEDVD